MGVFEHFPYTNFHDLNLGWVVGLVKELESRTGSLESWESQHETEYKVLAEQVQGLINNLVDDISPWDPSREYGMYSIVEYQGSNYIAINPVPVGANITDQNYWREANSVVEQINAIGLETAAIKAKQCYVMPEEFGAMGDGLTDDYNAFVAMVTEAVTNDKIIWLKPETTYFLGSSLSIPDPVSIVGNGAKLSASHGGDILTIGTGEHPQVFNNCDISEIELICNNTCTGAYISCLEGASFRNIQVINPGNYGIKVALCYGCTFDQIAVRNAAKIGLFLSYIQGVTTRFGNNSNTFNNVTVDHYNMDGSGAAGIHCEYSSGNVFNAPIVEFGNETQATGIGIYFDTCDTNTVNSPWLESNHCHVKNSGSNGITINSGHFTVYGNHTYAMTHCINSGKLFLFGPHFFRGVDLEEYKGAKTYCISEDLSYQVIITFTQFLMAGHFLLGLESNDSVIDATQEVVNRHNAGLVFRTTVGSSNNLNIMFGTYQPLLVDSYTVTEGDNYLNMQKNNMWGNKSFEMPIQPVMRTYSTNRPPTPPTGGMCFDMSLHKPIWYDGTNWRDATGTVLT